PRRDPHDPDRQRALGRTPAKDLGRPRSGGYLTGQEGAGHARFSAVHVVHGARATTTGASGPGGTGGGLGCSRRAGSTSWGRGLGTGGLPSRKSPYYAIGPANPVNFSPAAGRYSGRNRPRQLYSLSHRPGREAEEDGRGSSLRGVRARKPSPINQSASGRA